MQKCTLLGKLHFSGELASEHNDYSDVALSTTILTKILENVPLWIATSIAKCTSTQGLVNYPQYIKCASIGSIRHVHA